MTALATVVPARQPGSRPRTRPAYGRKRLSPVDLITLTAIGLRPVVVTLTILGAAIASSTRAHADPVEDAIGPVLNGTGQSLCPLLVAPGSSLAGDASHIGGNGGLAPPVAGLLAGMAIQAECPELMNSLADGNVPAPLQLPGMGLPAN